MLVLNVDLGMLPIAGELDKAVQKAAKEAGQQLALQAHAHLLEEAQKKLNSTRQKYIDAISFHQVDNDVWVINLDQSAMFVEQGMPRREMIDALLRSPKAKTSADGHRYMSIPFQHNKGPTQQTPAAKDLTDTIKSELQKRGIKYGGIETGQDGKPKLGLLHKFDITTDPKKTKEGPGQGHGPIGSVRQGLTGIPLLQGVRIYQRLNPLGGGVQKGIMTFRTVSSKHKGTGRWVHPGIEGRNLMDETAEWALSQWEKMKASIIQTAVGPQP